MPRLTHPGTAAHRPRDPTLRVAVVAGQAVGADHEAERAQRRRPARAPLCAALRVGRPRDAQSRCAPLGHHGGGDVDAAWRAGSGPGRTAAGWGLGRPWHSGTAAREPSQDTAPGQGRARLSKPHGALGCWRSRRGRSPPNSSANSRTRGARLAPAIRVLVWPRLLVLLLGRSRLALLLLRNWPATVLHVKDSASAHPSRRACRLTRCTRPHGPLPQHLTLEGRPMSTSAQPRPRGPTSSSSSSSSESSSSSSSSSSSPSAPKPSSSASASCGAPVHTPASGRVCRPRNTASPSQRVPQGLPHRRSEACCWRGQLPRPAAPLPLPHHCWLAFRYS
jgi:hypothetical protein